ncbi:MAG: thioesterase family protein [Caldilineaceae bacterium]
MHEPLLTLYTDIVRPEWIDYNGHLNDGYYAVAFSFATDAFMDYIGIDAAYRAHTRCTIYTAEMHITYLRELKAQAPLTFTTQLLAFDAKRCHIFHQMFHGTEHYLAATCELMQLHVDQSIGKVAVFPESVMNRLAEIYAVHQHVAIPAQVGHVMRMRRG